MNPGKIVNLALASSLFRVWKEAAFESGSSLTSSRVSGVEGVKVGIAREVDGSTKEGSEDDEGWGEGSSNWRARFDLAIG